MQAAIQKFPPTGLNAGHRASPPKEMVRCELERILQSSAFRGSHRSQEFLRYIVEKTLVPQLSDLKERHIAVELFGRPPAANLAEDTIVRVTAREVRRRLQQFYASPEGAGAVLQIHLSPGSYVPEFELVEPGIEVLRPIAEEKGEGAAPRPSRRRLFPRLAAWALAPAVIAVVLAWPELREAGASREAALAESFWRPVIHSGEEIVIGIPHPIVYQPSLRALRESARRQPAQEIPFQRPLALRPEELNGADFVAVQDQYVAFGDLLAASHLHAMMAVRQKRVRLRSASKINPADLKEAPSIQIGAFSNSWTLELGRDLRFRFSRTQDGRSCILDTATPGRFWALPTLTSDSAADQDYLLITRLRSGRWGQPAVLVAGLKQFGTGAGGELLSNPRRLGEVLRSIGDVRWPEANLQIVLETRVMEKTPSAPQLVAWHVW